MPFWRQHCCFSGQMKPVWFVWSFTAPGTECGMKLLQRLLRSLFSSTGTHLFAAGTNAQAAPGQWDPVLHVAGASSWHQGNWVSVGCTTFFCIQRIAWGYGDGSRLLTGGWPRSGAAIVWWWVPSFPSTGGTVAGARTQVLWVSTCRFKDQSYQQVSPWRY